MDIGRSIWASAVLTSAIFAGCSSVPRATKDGRLLNIWSQISTKSFIRVRGIGVTPPAISGQTQRRGQSRDAALVAARYQLLSVVKGVKLEGGLSIAQLMDQSSIIREIADEVVRGGEEVLTEWLPDDGCVITLELKRSTVERLISRGSPKERALQAEVERLKRMMSTKLDQDELAAIDFKALFLQSITDEHDRLGREPSPSATDVSAYVAKVRRYNELDVQQVTQDFRWSREHGQSYPTQAAWDHLNQMDQQNRQWLRCHPAPDYLLIQGCGQGEAANTPSSVEPGLHK